MTDSLTRLIAIALGGAFGAMSRYGVGLLCERAWGDRFAFGTLVVNTLGCFLLGFLMHEIWLANAGEEGPKTSVPLWHSGLTVGLLGGLTTFSTFGYQTIRHVEAGEFQYAFINVLANVILGLAAASLGLATARYVTG